jgi:5-methylcytosine-specific restriction endonuclease McrA
VPALPHLAENKNASTVRAVVTSVLDRPVLVLNRLWQPVNTCTVRRAVTLMVLGHAHVVSVDEEQNFATHDIRSWREVSSRTLNGHAATSPDVLRTVSAAFMLPQIIVVTLYDRMPKKDVKLTRQNIFIRDKHICQYCGRIFEVRDLNLDHVIPRDKGGRTTWENLVTSCVRCNTRKSNKLPSEARMFPLQEPRPPRWRPFFSAVRGMKTCESWRYFLDLEQAN